MCINRVFIELVSSGKPMLKLTLSEEVWVIFQRWIGYAHPTRAACPDLGHISEDELDISRADTASASAIQDPARTNHVFRVEDPSRGWSSKLKDCPRANGQFLSRWVETR